MSVASDIVTNSARAVANAGAVFYRPRDNIAHQVLIEYFFVRNAKGSLIDQSQFYTCYHNSLFFPWLVSLSFQKVIRDYVT